FGLQVRIAVRERRGIELAELRILDALPDVRHHLERGQRALSIRQQEATERQLGARTVAIMRVVIESHSDRCKPPSRRAQLVQNEKGVVVDEKRRVQRIGFAFVLVAAAQQLLARPSRVRLILERRPPELGRAGKRKITHAKRRGREELSRRQRLAAGSKRIERRLIEKL